MFCSVCFLCNYWWLLAIFNWRLMSLNNNVCCRFISLSAIDIINVYQTDCLTDKLVNYRCTLCSRERKEIFYLCFYPISSVKMFQSLWFLTEISSVIIYTAFKWITTSGVFRISQRGGGLQPTPPSLHPSPSLLPLKSGIWWQQYLWFSWESTDQISCTLKSKGQSGPKFAQPIVLLM